MATFSGGGRTREPGESWQMQVKDATSFDDAGFVLTYITETIRKVDKCGATDVPVAVNYRSTRDPLDLNEPPTKFLIGSAIGEKGIEVLSDGWIKLKVATDNVAMVRGDPLVCTGGGKVDKYTPTPITNGTLTASETETRFDELARIVGYVEDDIVAVGTTLVAGADKVKAKITIRSNGIIT